MNESGPLRRGLIDVDQRTSGSRSLSVEAIGDHKFFHATTGVLAVGASYDVYLTGNGKAGGDKLFGKTPSVKVYSDATAAPGGFPRGQGPLGPGYAYSISPHTGFLTSWNTANERWYVRVTNSTSSACDFVVIASGL